MKRGGSTTGLYDVRRADGSSCSISDSYKVAEGRLQSDPEAMTIAWIPREKLSERVDTFQAFSKEES